MARRILVTAAAAGIGAAIARRAKAQGYDVLISDIDREGGERLAAEAGLTFIPCDLTSEDDIVSLVSRVGRVDLLVNNGGIAGTPSPSGCRR
jgi:NAD(P)-dependent dehydrogenase (short-subunit alcohol dehydrogenase family)